MKVGETITKTFGFFGIIIVIFSGMTFVTFRERIIQVWNLPKQMEQLVKYKHTQDSLNQLNEWRWEMDFELDRLMTDDIDTLYYFIVTDRGVPYNVDVRSTAEGLNFGFVYEMYIPYRVKFDDADHNRRKYIMLHSTKEKQNTYLFLK